MVCICLLSFQSTYAQFWVKEKPKPKSTAKPIHKASITAAAKPIKKKIFEYPQSTKKDKYRIDILATLYFDELVENGKPRYYGKVPEKASTSLSFCEGAQLAIDTLNTMGYKTDIYIHDVSNTAAADKLIRDNNFQSTDLIIGFISSTQIKPWADFALKNQINFVSAFSPSDAEIKNNPYFVIINPSLQSHCEKIIESIKSEHIDDKPLVVLKRNSISIDSTAFSYLKDSLNLKSSSIIDISKAQIDSATLASMLEEDKENILLIPIMDYQYAEESIQLLKKYFPAYKFKIYGMPTWKALCTNKKMIDLGDKFSIVLSKPYNFEQETQPMKELNDAYAFKYNGKPNELTYRGYELSFWFVDLVNKYGAVFNDKTKDLSMAPFTKFKLEPNMSKQGAINYIENKYLYLIKYQNGLFFIN